MCLTSVGFVYVKRISELWISTSFVGLVSMSSVIADVDTFDDAIISELEKTQDEQDDMAHDSIISAWLMAQSHGTWLDSPVSLHGCLSTSPHDGRSDVPIDETGTSPQDVPIDDMAHGSEPLRKKMKSDETVEAAAPKTPEISALKTPPIRHQTHPQSPWAQRKVATIMQSKPQQGSAVA